MTELLAFNCPLCRQLECPINKHFVKDGNHPSSVFKWCDPHTGWNAFLSGCWKCNYPICSINQLIEETFKFHPELFKNQPIIPYPTLKS